MEEVKPYVMKTPRPRPEKPDAPPSSDYIDPPLQSPRPADFMLARQRLSEVSF